MSLPKESSKRKRIPIYSGLLAYFPDALAAVAEVSFIGNEQHNPGEPLHWAREKSTDQEDCVARHVLDHATGERFDPDGGRIMAKVAWRALASLQLEIEKEWNEQTSTDSHDRATTEREVDNRSRAIQGPLGPYSAEGRNQVSLNGTEIPCASGADGKDDQPLHDREFVSSWT